jgi:N-acetylglucosamine-6-phosphate deacetylase
MAAVRLGVDAAFVDGELVPGDVEIAGASISSIGLAAAGSGHIALPGFVDLQVNGFAGVDFTFAGPDDYRAVGGALVATGVTAYQPTLITLPEAAYLEALARAAEAGDDPGSPRITGIHLEGPFLSPDRSGAHDPDNTRDPDRELMDRLLESGRVRFVTLAPERPGALDLIEHLTAQGIVVACGHTDATAAVANAAFDRGATAVTHLYGAQRPFHHRDPGIVGAALARDGIVVTIIVDGVHLADETVQLTARAAAGRFAVITDAIAAAGMPDGSYPLGDQAVQVRDGEARLENGTLAGSVLTMDRAVRNLLSLGIPVESAVAAATSTPARLIGRPELGTLRPGTPADVAVVDEGYTVVRTLVAGKEVFAAG